MKTNRIEINGLATTGSETHSDCPMSITLKYFVEFINENNLSIIKQERDMIKSKNLLVFLFHSGRGSIFNC